MSRATEIHLFLSLSLSFSNLSDKISGFFSLYKYMWISSISSVNYSFSVFHNEPECIMHNAHFHLHRDQTDWAKTLRRVVAICTHDRKTHHDHQLHIYVLFMFLCEMSWNRLAKTQFYRVYKSRIQVATFRYDTNLGHRFYTGQLWLTVTSTKLKLQCFLNGISTFYGIHSSRALSSPKRKRLNQTVELDEELTLSLNAMSRERERDISSARKRDRKRRKCSNFYLLENVRMPNADELCLNFFRFTKLFNIIMSFDNVLNEVCRNVAWMFHIEHFHFPFAEHEWSSHSTHTTYHVRVSEAHQVNASWN